MTNELYDGLLGTGLVVIVYHLYKYSKINIKLVIKKKKIIY